MNWVLNTEVCRFLFGDALQLDFNVRQVQGLVQKLRDRLITAPSRLAMRTTAGCCRATLKLRNTSPTLAIVDGAKG
jgi:hypothetical protein